MSKTLAPFSTSARLASVFTSGCAGTKLILCLAKRPCMAGLVAQSISFLPASAFLAPLIMAMASAEVPMPSFGKLMTTSYPLALVSRASTMKKMPPAAAPAFCIELDVGAELLEIGEGFVLIAAVDLEHREDACDRGAGRARVGHLQHILVGGVEQVVPGRRRRKLVLGQELLIAHEHQGIIGIFFAISISALEPPCH